MSEYQYYDFQAIDKPLTNKEMEELRSYSTRARITPTSFTNDYSWGRFKGNEDAWMEKYFDAFLYTANWGTHVLKLGLSSRLLDLEIANLYCSGNPASAREKKGKVILTFVSDDEGGDEWVEGEGLLSSLISLRAELARGDLRSLYLGWLLCLQTGEVDDEEEEPPVPPGLGHLSASLKSLAEFLRIDDDLLRVAAQASRPLEDFIPNQEQIRNWIRKLPIGEKDDLLTRFIAGEEPSLGMELMTRFMKENTKGRLEWAESDIKRTGDELLRAAEEFAAKRRELTAKRQAEEKARREKEMAAARTEHLDRIAGRESELFKLIDKLISTKQPKGYDRAVELILDLRDVAARNDKTDEFQARLNAICEAQSRKPSFLERLRKAGL